MMRLRSLLAGLVLFCLPNPVQAQTPMDFMYRGPVHSADDLDAMAERGTPVPPGLLNAMLPMDRIARFAPGSDLRRTFDQLATALDPVANPPDARMLCQFDQTRLGCSGAPLDAEARLLHRDGYFDHHHAFLLNVRAVLENPRTQASDRTNALHQLAAFWRLHQEVTDSAMALSTGVLAGNVTEAPALGQLLRQRISLDGEIRETGRVSARLTLVDQPISSPLPLPRPAGDSRADIAAEFTLESGDTPDRIRARLSADLPFTLLPGSAACEPVSDRECLLESDGSNLPLRLSLRLDTPEEPPADLPNGARLQPSIRAWSEIQDRDNAAWQSQAPDTLALDFAWCEEAFGPALQQVTRQTGSVEAARTALANALRPNDQLDGEWPLARPGVVSDALVERFAEDSSLRTSIDVMGVIDPIVYNRGILPELQRWPFQGGVLSAGQERLDILLAAIQTGDWYRTCGREADLRDAELEEARQAALSAAERYRTILYTAQQIQAHWLREIERDVRLMEDERFIPVGKDHDFGNNFASWTASTAFSAATPVLNDRILPPLQLLRPSQIDVARLISTEMDRVNVLTVTLQAAELAQDVLLTWPDIEIKAEEVQAWMLVGAHAEVGARRLFDLADRIAAVRADLGVVEQDYCICSQR